MLSCKLCQCTTVVKDIDFLDNILVLSWRGKWLLLPQDDLLDHSSTAKTVTYILMQRLKQSQL